MSRFKILATLLLLAAGATSAQPTPPPAQVTPLMTQALPDYPGKNGVVITVEYPPGGESPVHRHNAHAFVYVLEGSIVMGVRGGKTVTLGPGQTFHEGPDDIHTVSRNASRTEPARFLVVLLKNAGEPISMPAH
ncbi:cupin domain-containing protein [Zoogloeaceae bacterium G21618-S1]|nr:cupin domain-containing protein [Zoogloeaceae bacterium G21618-S1]